MKRLFFALVGWVGGKRMTGVSVTKLIRYGKMAMAIFFLFCLIVCCCFWRSDDNGFVGIGYHKTSTADIDLVRAISIYIYLPLNQTILLLKHKISPPLLWFFLLGRLQSLIICVIFLTQSTQEVEDEDLLHDDMFDEPRKKPKKKTTRYPSVTRA